METETLQTEPKILTIKEICHLNEVTYEVPIYQRDYAWGKGEIFALIQDIYDSHLPEDWKPRYFIGTLVTSPSQKGNQVYEIIDGQQRLTTIKFILNVLDEKKLNDLPNIKLSYRARKKSNDTLQSISGEGVKDKHDEYDQGILNGFKYTKAAIDDVIPKDKLESFIKYFQNNVHLIHYQVPDDIDLNHYYEIMNSRGKQLKKHEILKVRLIDVLAPEDKAKFYPLWESCSEMGVYIQQKYRQKFPDKMIFAKIPFVPFDNCEITGFDRLPADKDNNTGKKSISEIIKIKPKDADEQQTTKDIKVTFQPIIDFPNFLLVVLKLTCMKDENLRSKKIILNDKNLLEEFDKAKPFDANFVKRFGFNLLKAKYFLDNYLVHQSHEDNAEDATIENNPWKLQYWDDGDKTLKNLTGDRDVQRKLVQLLSMFEVTFDQIQQKNYLFYCLLHLFHAPVQNQNVAGYYDFVSNLARKYFFDYYLTEEKSRDFDETILSDKKPYPNITLTNKDYNFTSIYGDGNGTEAPPKTPPSFVFNYLDYLLWEKYFCNIRGKKEEHYERINFFKNKLGCSDFGLDVFDKFYFSRTRNTLEHYFPRAQAQANLDVKNDGVPTKMQIECFGNYTMIAGDENSSGSDKFPVEKLDRYLGTHKKFKEPRVGVASLKFMIMMQMCLDNHNDNNRAWRREWKFDDITLHQNKMLAFLKVK